MAPVYIAKNPEGQNWKKPFLKDCDQFEFGLNWLVKYLEYKREKKLWDF